MDRAIEQPLQFDRAGLTDRFGQGLRVHQYIVAGFRPSRRTPRTQPVGHLIGREPNHAHDRHITEQQLR